jgi:NhaP-type Na+/H+ or K+/H+ antiporter
MKRISIRVQSDPVGLILATLLLIALIWEFAISRNLLSEVFFGVTLGLVVGYNLRLVIEKRR